MIARSCLIALLSLAGCAAPRKAPSPPPAPAAAPASLRNCPQGVPVPPAPRPPRTIEQVGDWARRTAKAAETNEQARANCARKLEQLNAWITQRR